jgi:hypothetical protein
MYESAPVVRRTLSGLLSTIGLGSFGGKNAGRGGNAVGAVSNSGQECDLACDLTATNRDDSGAGDACNDRAKRLHVVRETVR